MRALALAALLPMTHPAACHHFSIWKYPTAQHCGVVRVAEQKVVPTPPVKEEPLVTISPLNTIVLRPDPNRTDEQGRALAIEMLKVAMPNPKEHE